MKEQVFISLSFEDFKNIIRDSVNEALRESNIQTADDDPPIPLLRAAQLLNKSKSTLRLWKKQGKLTPVFIGGELCFRKSEIMKIRNGEGG